MKKSQKIEYINKIYKQIFEAPNHGRGGSWWYPKSGVVAYNVKMHNWASVEDLREKLSEKQNGYYTDEGLEDVIFREQADTCEFLLNDILEDFGLEAFFAGRSDGWVEVDFSTAGSLDIVDEHTDSEDVQVYFEEAKKLEKIEANVAKFIKQRHAEYNKYIGSDSYFNELIGGIYTDEEIVEIYRKQAKALIDKI